MIKLKKLKFSYSNSPVIDELDWELETGEIHGLIGLNGAGKTTLFNIMAGWLKPATGTLLFNEKPLHRLQSGFMETNPNFYPMITGQEYLDIFKLKNQEFDSDAWNRVFKLPLKEVVDNYSTGMQKRLSLMGILALNRDILILDEPFNGLDFEAVRLVSQILPSLASKGKTVIISSHIPESLTTICNSVSLIRNGKIEFKIRQPQFAELQNLIDYHGGFDDERFPL